MKAKPLFLKVISCCVITLFCVPYIHGQRIVIYSKGILNKPPVVEFIKTDSGLIIKRKIKTACKTYGYLTDFVPEYLNTPTMSSSIIYKKDIRPKLITVHGNIGYDFFYRSMIDTPFNQKGLQQHTEKMYLDVLIKEKYPLKVGFTLRQSNSPYFQNFADINMHFDPYSYRKNFKQELINKVSEVLSNAKDSKSIDSLITIKRKRLSTLQNWVKRPSTLQSIIEEREFSYNRQQQLSFPSTTMPVIPNTEFNLSNYFKKNKFFNVPAVSKQKLDNSTDSFTQLFTEREKEIDSLSGIIKTLINRKDSLQYAIQKNVITTNQQIYKARDQKELIKIATINGIYLSKEDKHIRGLSAIRSFSIGRSMINYTELTAQDITVTGINVEYNPSYYAAFAAGTINYCFRDFYNKSIKNTGQYLVLGRIGMGNPDKRALILTVFKGQKIASEYLINDSGSHQIGIIGYSLESIFKKNEHTSVSFEVAKSTKPSTGGTSGNKQLGTLWQFSDQSNLGVNIKAQTIVNETNTKLSGFYRKTGQSFQSFSLFSYNSDQTAWLARADQYFLKERISISGMLRRNDFTNPFTEKTYKTSTVFKSFILNVRVPKYPLFSAGYYPGTQLFLIDKETIRENAYYLLNGSLTYSYSFKKIKMNSLVVYNQYFNKATDSGFGRYQGVNYYEMQTIYLNKLQLQAGFAYNRQPGMVYTTTEASVDYSLKQSVKLGTGIKYNKVFDGNTYWGEKVELLINVPGIGRLQLQYEKSYLPTISDSLFPVEIGRVSWYKFF